MRRLLIATAVLVSLGSAFARATCVGIAYDQKNDALGTFTGADTKEEALNGAILSCAGNPADPTDPVAQASIDGCAKKQYYVCNGFIAISIGAQAEPDGLHHLGVFAYNYDNSFGKSFADAMNDAVVACQKFNPVYNSCVSEPEAIDPLAQVHFFSAETGP